MAAGKLEAHLSKVDLNARPRIVSHEPTSPQIGSKATAGFDSCWDAPRTTLRSARFLYQDTCKPACSRLDCAYQRDFVKDRCTLSFFGRASLTVRLRPSRNLPSRAAIAALPPAALLIVTKANPRDLPVMRSVTRCTSVTFPYCANRSFRSGSVERITADTLNEPNDLSLRSSGKLLEDD